MEKTINAVIIDDDENFIASLVILLGNNFENVKIVGIAYSVEKAISLINGSNPDLIFLDINLPDGTGFDILEQTNHKEYETIFTTSFSEHAIKAFEFSALHYLLKPLDEMKLQEAIGRYSKLHEKDLLDEKLQILKESLMEKPQRILLPSSAGLCVHNISEIVRCEADNNYSHVFFNNNKIIMLSKPLQQLDKMLNGLDFVRIHSKHLINLRYVAKYHRGMTPSVMLTDKTDLPITQTYKTEFIERLKNFAKYL